MKKKSVYLIQPEITSGATPEHYLPFSVGCIWAFANQYDEIKNNFELRDVVWRRDRHKDVLEKIIDPDIVGFSCYVWNHKWNLVLAEKIKRLYPNCLIVFGGPSINEKWLVHNFIDVAMFGEGEIAWANMLKMIAAGQPVPRYWHNPRQEDITDFPSPYLTGFFDKIIDENPEVMWFMMLETNRGCPYHCTFCGWGADYLNKLKIFNIQRVAEEIQWAITHNIHWVFVIDANSGILKERDVEIAWMVREAIEDSRSKITRVTFNHAKNLNDSCFEMEKIIQDWTYGLEIAIQSLHEPTLIASKRNNMGMHNLQRAYALCKKYNIRYYTELVLGLPLETKESYINGLVKLMELGQHESVKTYLATVIPNSEMDSEEYRNKYGIKLIYPRDMYRSPEERKWDVEDCSYEDIAMVCETNTASRQDIADCLTYAWIISQFHYSGYSQLVSRYLFHMHNISYKVFYDRLYQILETDTIGGNLLSSVEEILISYLKHGEVPDDSKWHNVVALTLSESFGGETIYEHKDYFIHLAIQIANEFTNLPSSIADLQKAFVKDDLYEYPFVVKSTIDIDRWENKDCQYQIKKRFSVSPQQDQMYGKWLRKTDLHNITDPYIEKCVYNNYDEDRRVIPIINNPLTVVDGRVL